MDLAWLEERALRYAARWEASAAGVATLLERKILEGLDSPARQMTPEDWQELRRTLRDKLTERQ